MTGNEYSLLTDQEIHKREAPSTGDGPGDMCGNGNAVSTIIQVNGGVTTHETENMGTTDANLGTWDPYSIVKLSVSGKVYVTMRKTLTFFPETLLGSKEIEDYWSEDLGMYYFNRHRGVFNSILFFYQSRGIFRAPTNVEQDIMKEELDFFKVDVQQILEFKDEDEEDEVEEKLTFRQKMHTFLSDPQYSKPALYWSFVDMFAIVLSIILLVAESVPSAAEAFENPKYTAYYFLYGLEVLVNGFFSVDFILKFISWPKPWLFFKNPLNCLDFMAILPFYMELIALISQSESGGSKFVVLRICRTSRVVRIFRFARHSKELLVVMKVVSSASKEFAMLAMLIMVFVLLFGTFLYYSEMGYDSNFDSILHG